MSGVAVIRSAISGRAAAIALPTAAGELMVPDSPTPFVPPGVTGDGGLLVDDADVRRFPCGGQAVLGGGLAVGRVDDLLVERHADALRHSPADLPVDDGRVDQDTGVVDHPVPLDLDGAGPRVHRHGRGVRTGGVHVGGRVVGGLFLETGRDTVRQVPATPRRGREVGETDRGARHTLEPDGSVRDLQIVGRDLEVAGEPDAASVPVLDVHAPHLVPQHPQEARVVTGVVLLSHGRRDRRFVRVEHVAPVAGRPGPSRDGGRPRR